MDILQRLAQRDQQTGGIGRHSILLASLLLLFLLLPVFQHLPGGGIRFTILLMIVLCAAVYASSSQRWTLIVAGLMAGGSMVASAIARTHAMHDAQIVADSLGLALFGFTTLLLLNTLLQTKDVSRDTVVGGICVYLLIGLCFGMTFILITDLHPGTFVDHGQPLIRTSADGGDTAAAVLYYSFVTLTTLGYGDILPTGESARMLAALEAVIGQLFVAIFIARLIARRGP
jgi:hypothetical protein